MTATTSTPALTGVRRTVLPNGLTVLIRRDTAAPVVAIVTYVRAGYFDETDDIIGIAHVLEHMFFKGTARRGVGDIAKETKSSGGYLNAHTIYDHTSYYTVLPSSAFAAGLDIQADAYANSAIDAGELARELEVIIQEAKRKADSPSAVATETLYEMLHDRHRMRRWRIGREPGLRALTREKLTSFYRNFYKPSSTILSIVGDIDPDEAMRLVERTYGSIPGGEPERNPGPAEPAHDDFRWREWQGDIQQAQIVLGWRTPGSLDDDTPLLDLASTILGTGRASRLYRSVRERSLASSVGASNYTPTELGVFLVHAEAPLATSRDALAAMWAEVQGLADGIDPLELERARRIFEARWIRRLESMESQASYLAEWEALGGVELGDRYLDRVMSATAAEVCDAVRRHLGPERAGVAIYRPNGDPLVADDRSLRELLAKAKPLPRGGDQATSVAASNRLEKPSFEGETAGVRVYRTRSGIPILVRRRAGAPIVHIGVVASGGARDEGLDRAGLTALVARTAVKGTTHRTAAQIAEDAEMLGGSVGASAGGESFGWSISVPTRHLEAAIELVADVAQFPVFNDDALEVERTVALADVRSLRDDMYRYPMRLAAEAAFGTHPYGVPASGTEASLVALTRDDLVRWHREHFLAAPTVIGVVGDGDPEEIAAIVGARFRELRIGVASTIAPPPSLAGVQVREEQRAKAQTAIAMIFAGPARNDDARFAAGLLAGITSGLGGRFFDELRDRRSLAYTVHTFAIERPLGGTFGAYIATSPDKEEIARRGLLEEFARLREDGVTEDELSRAQRYAVGVHAIRQQSGGAVLGDMLDAWMFGRGLEELEEHDARINAVTRDEVRALARRYFDAGRRAEGIVRGVERTV